jgi:hypothetical protein
MSFEDLNGLETEVETRGSKTARPEYVFAVERAVKRQVKMRDGKRFRNNSVFRQISRGMFFQV